MQLEENNDTCQGSTALFDPRCYRIQLRGDTEGENETAKKTGGNNKRIRNLETTHSMESKEGYPVRQE